MWWLQNVSGINLFLRNAKHCNNWRYISIKIAPLCNYILLPVTVKVLKTFLEAILWKTFQLLRRILSDVNSRKIAPSMLLSVEWAGNNQLESGFVGYSSVVTLFFARKSLTKTDRCAGALSWRRNQLFVLSFYRHFFLTVSLRRRTVSKIHFFILSNNSGKSHQRIPGTLWSYYMLRAIFFLSVLLGVIGSKDALIKHPQLVVIYQHVGCLSVPGCVKQ